MKNAIPLDAPRVSGKELFIRELVDDDFTGEKLSRKSRTGFIVLRIS